jgi:hypothetical protein
MDLSPDGRWALLGRDNDGLTLVATGTGTRRKVPLPSLEFRPPARRGYEPALWPVPARIRATGSTPSISIARLRLRYPNR